ncbi:pyruvate kinase [Magnetococcus marinus MC-1]|uniref:Pyruvate kinase n=1 Tax=Magnetococcus marinus (strain ATCC BAA-1437 / JCM 17883 / MC-1) TaxID=156889 RepID=A0L7K0_MAGMM|nr:pyruvate kinase [Magnetococcus marinus]ABK43943.1 pyruvate kinase [Magnetococcus marinus MC-1]
MARRAKIVATLGPACSSVEQITRLIEAGLDVARLNMSHGDHKAHLELIHNVREASRIAKREVALLCDLQGPKIRVGHLDEPLRLEKGQQWAIIPEGSHPPKLKCDGIIPCTYAGLAKDAVPGCRILFDDGYLQARAIGTEEGALLVNIEHGGLLKSHKGINMPDASISAPSLTTKDQQDLFFGVKHDVDYVALSFVRSAKCVQNVKFMLHRRKIYKPIIAKIERPEAIRNIDEIIKVVDGIMIARGDMAVEIGNHRVPSVQRQIIQKCRAKGKPVITATQMLESMIQNPSPTRAEASDVANAIWDGTDAVMLSAETSVGVDPINTVLTMGRIVEEAERNPRGPRLDAESHSISSASMMAAARVAEQVSARWIIALTVTGSSALSLARFRPEVPVLGAARTQGGVRRMNLYWGITPRLFNYSIEEREDIEPEVIQWMREQSMLQVGEKIVVVKGGGLLSNHSTSSSIRVDLVRDTRNIDEGVSQITQESVAGKGIITLDAARCVACGNCVNICPYGIWVAAASNTRSVSFNRDQVDNCSLDQECVRVCSSHAITITDAKDMHEWVEKEEL